MGPQTGCLPPPPPPGNIPPPPAPTAKSGGGGLAGQLLNVGLKPAAETDHGDKKQVQSFVRLILQQSMPTKRKMMKVLMLQKSWPEELPWNFRMKKMIIHSKMMIGNHS